MPSEITRLVDDLVAQMRSRSGPGYRAALRRLGEAARAGGPESATAVIEALAPWLRGLHGDYAMTAVLAGACVEWGGSPTALVGVLPERASEAMMLNAALPEFWGRATRWRPLPEPVSASTGRLVKTLGKLARQGADEGFLTRMAMSWFDMEDWLKALITLLARGPFRTAVAAPVKAGLREHAAAVADRSQRAAWVGQLAAVLDDEPLLVLDPRIRRGYALTMGGIGDNFQMHTLLADRLIGDPEQGLVAGERPARSWVEAATDGDPNLGTSDPAIRRFRLFDGHGGYVHPEGIPADIEPLDGTRVLVLHPPNGTFGMGVGRVFEHMTPTLELDRVLEPAQTQLWFDRVAPAVENDLMAG
ncbi:hypothetical protein AB0N07_12780 [Streptomyces sp. NPDC051172]|uniref:hypothetical protein n=1 Tax=Streptomyces sp. NPDC051172 TaxID=3155796 RepID=UPI003414E225